MIKKDNMSFCFRCYHNWNKRKQGNPKYCPKCKSPYWNRPRKKVSKQLTLKIQETIINLHDTIIKISGGTDGIRDEAGIFNSTYKMLINVNKNRKDPTKIGTLILHEFAKRHYFVDGNKRTAYVLAKVFMLINKCHLKTEYSEALNFILEIAKHDSTMTFETIEFWLKENCVYIDEKEVENYLNRVFVNLTIGEKDEQYKNN